MIVTDKNFFMEEKLIGKLDLMIDRMNGTDDNVVVVDGEEGQGKTNIVAGICYYVSNKTGREYNIKNIFFDLDELIKFASETKEKIIHWDEGALGGLSVQWWKANQIKFVQLLMIARKKKHFIVICIPKFHKLQEYLIVDRSIALIHVYSRQNIHKGRFFYYTKQKKELLFDEWKRIHRKSYGKYRSFGGSFLEYMKKVFTEEQINEYEVKKDKAILSLNSEEGKMTKQGQKWKEQRDKMIKIMVDKFGFSLRELEKELKEEDLSITYEGIRHVLKTVSCQASNANAI